MKPIVTLILKKIWVSSSIVFMNIYVLDVGLGLIFPGTFFERKMEMGLIFIISLSIGIFYGYFDRETELLKSKGE